ncbi:MAG: glycosyltransferase family 4 protein [Xanthomonadales bacterium]|nr:glycosyltransferase family 4 protein [Xanthomonadales bacterium]
MRIGLDITQAVKTRGRGIARYILNVAPLLAKDRPGLEAVFCIRGQRWFRRSLVRRIAPATRRACLPLPFVMNVRGLDLFHSFGNHLPAWSPVPRTFTVHDFRALDLSGGGRSSRLHRNIERADGIICLTEHGRSRLMEHYPEFNTACVTVIPHGVDHQVFYPRDPATVARRMAAEGLERPFLLQLGSWFPHKNLEMSIRAYARSRAREQDFDLVFVGGGAPAAYLKSLRELVQAEGVADRVTWIEDADERRLPVLLNAASCLLQPSRYEGFALPLLEAMASGVPGVVSDSSCLPEVSNGIWPICGEDDIDAFARGIDAMTLDGAMRSEAVRRGLDHAAGFTWRRTADMTAAFFHDVLATKA